MKGIKTLYFKINMATQNQPLDDFFHTVSRLLIVFPLVIIIIAIYLKFNNDSSYKKSALVTSGSQTEQKSKTSYVKGADSINSHLKLDLNGPFICKSENQGASLSAYIKDKMVLIDMSEKNIQQNLLLRDDCIYFWQSGNFSGEKICGLTNYVNMAEKLLASNLLNASTLFNALNQFDNLPSGLKDKVNLDNLVSSCAKNEISNNSLFNIPNNILFKNKK